MCRQFKSGRNPFSPEASIWIRRTQVYCSLLRYHAGKIRNKGNLKQSAQRCGIECALSISIREIYERSKICISQCDFFCITNQALSPPSAPAQHWDTMELGSSPMPGSQGIWPQGNYSVASTALWWAFHPNSGTPSACTVDHQVSITCNAPEAVEHQVIVQ